MSYDDLEDARLYDAQNPWGPAEEFYLSLVMSAGDVLDVGCGTGTLLKRARRDGHRGRLVGLDPGAGMLAVAREEPGIEWVQGVLVPGAYEAEFDLVTMTGHAFQELRTEEDIRAVLRGMRDAVRPGGRVAFETRNPLVRPWESWPGQVAEYEFAGVGTYGSAGDARFLGRTLRAYGYRDDQLDAGLRRRLLAWLLLHYYSNLPAYLERLPAPAEPTLEALADRWFATA